MTIRVEMLPILDMIPADCPTIQLAADKIPQLIGKLGASSFALFLTDIHPARKIADKKCPVS